MDTYEKYLGPIHPGFIKPVSAGLQESLRELEQERLASMCWARFNVSHKTIGTTEIGSVLLIEPDYVLDKGESYYRDKKYDLKSDHNSWSLSSLDKIKSKEPEAHLEWIMQQLFGKLPQVRALQERGAKMRITIHSEGLAVAALELSSDLLRRIAQLGCPVTVIFHPPDKGRNKRSLEMDV
jgi:hypothetical protein